MFSFKKNLQISFTDEEIEEKLQKTVELIQSLSKEELTKILKNGKNVPDDMKLKLYNFLIEYNEIDALIDKMYTCYLGKVRSVSSNERETDTTLNRLFKTGKLSELLNYYHIYSNEELKIKLVTIESSIKLRDRIAHSIPYWYERENIVLFYSYDSVFWNKFFNNIRESKLPIYNAPYYKKYLSQKKLSDFQFSYVAYHIAQVNALYGWLRAIRLACEKSWIDTMCNK